MKLGEVLVKANKLTPEQLNLALAEQQKSKEYYLGEILVQQGLSTDEDIASALAELAGVPRVNLETHPIDPAAAQIPGSFSKKHQIVPLSTENGRIQVAMTNPLNIVLLDEIKLITRKEVDVLVATENDIRKAREALYAEGAGDERTASEKTAASLAEAIKKTEGLDLAEDAESLTDHSPVIELVSQIIFQAVKAEATDIHIEPEEKGIRVRYRIDGIIHQFAAMQKTLQSAIITRIKILSNLDISESRIPQDGRFELKVDDKLIDLRISTFPGVYGENVVMRILDKNQVTLGLEKLGFSPRMLSLYKQAITRPNGIILVTGPTGSGKTTTLYSTISQLNAKEKNIITLEDPVEYMMPMIRQSQINLKAGLTFSYGLRAILRQDPDIILVGEIRDGETVEIAIRAALTGHLVFSTLHTNDAAGAVTRLLDMGVEPYLLTSSLILVLSQRLVRMICRHCTAIDHPDEKFLATLGLRNKPVTFHKGKGCARCNHTGYRGRIGIFEAVRITSKIGGLIIEGKNAQVIKKAARQEGSATMLEDGVLKATKGVTTLDEVFRVAYI